MGPPGPGRSALWPGPARIQHGDTSQPPGRQRTTITAVVAVLLLTAACGPDPVPPALGPGGQAVSPDPGGAVRDFFLTARPADVQLKPGLPVQAWTYNGMVPGPLLRVRVGDLVRVHLRNLLPEGTTIHWHGLAVPNGEDGVAGVTQDPVPPGASVTYAFVARQVGTYWYHSHQLAAEQVDRGLYGALVVDPAGDPDPPAVDRTLVYDEWPWGLERTSPTAPPGPASLLTYVTYAVNGRTGAAIEPVRFQPGRRVRLRLVNAGYLTHRVQLEGAPVTIAAFDGHAVSRGPATGDALTLGAGERLDLDLVAPAHALWLRLVDALPPAADAVVPLLPLGMAVPGAPAGPTPAPLLDPLTYPAWAVQPVWPAAAVPSRTFTLTITRDRGTVGGMAGMTGMAFQVNGRRFPDTDTLVVRRGDLVQMTFVNRTGMEHAMHLHGHVFQVLAADGAAVPGAIAADTVVVAPGRSVTVGFVADNPGWWMVHCHQLYHAEGGLMVLLRYEGVPRPAQLGGPWHAMPD
jgi:FtsP/CotA-like multicopper oxidase with cupredoxin domain